MNLAEVRAELEEEFTWRGDEIRFLRNQLSDLTKVHERDRFRRAMVVMLYSHFEGFWKAAFMIYVKALNAENIAFAEANHALLAASATNIFEALADSNRKADFFRNTAPDDVKLHRFCRHAEFAGRIEEFSFRRVVIDPDCVVDTESNLKPVVIRKNLFRLGFDYKLFSHHEGTINWLLQKRNNVAHGGTRAGVDETEYDPLEIAVMDVMKSVIQIIYTSLRERRYLRPLDGEWAI